MIRDSIVAKLWLTIVAMVIVVLALLSVLLQQFFDNYVYQQQSRELTRLATMVQLLVNQNDFNFAEKAAQQLAFVEDAHIDIAMPISSKSQVQALYNGFQSSEKARLTTGESISVRGTASGTDTVSVYLLIRAGAAHPGLIIVTQDMSVLEQPLATIRNIIIFAVVLGVLLTTGLAFVVSKNLSRPLIQMNKVAEDMAQGNFHWQIDVMTNDEVGRLGRTFNALANQLDRTIEALYVERDQLSSILLSMEDGVVAADLEGKITIANPPAIRRLDAIRFTESDESGESGESGETRLPTALQTLQASVLDGNDTVVREVHWQGRTIVITMLPLYESDGERLRGSVAVLRDVTEERRIERLRKDFIANVSHELRTPLSMMQGYTEALLDEFGNDPVHRRELTEIIHDETLRMRRLVNDLLDLAQLESGQFQMTFTNLDAMNLTKRVVRKFSTLATERSIQLKTKIPSTPVRVRADFDRLEQVLTNLLDNAIRHTAPQGTVEIDVSANRQYVKIGVVDTGSGIPDEDLPYIWERFYKADKARTRGSAGTGLGLAISRHIVTEHGGDITVESVVGKGTTFTVVLPIQQEPGAEDLDSPQLSGGI